MPHAEPALAVSADRDAVPCPCAVLGCSWTPHPAVQGFASATPCSLLFPQEGKCEPSSAHSPGQESSWSILLKQSLSSPLFLPKPEKRTKTLSLSFGNLLIGSPVKLQRLCCLIMIVNDRDYQVYLVMSLGSLQLV